MERKESSSCKEWNQDMWLNMRRLLWSIKSVHGAAYEDSFVLLFGLINFPIIL